VDALDGVVKVLNRGPNFRKSRLFGCPAAEVFIDGFDERMTIIEDQAAKPAQTFDSSIDIRISMVRKCSALSVEYRQQAA